METTMTAEASANEELLADAQACGQLIAARAYLYTLLHKVLGGEPTAELLAVISGDTVQEALSELAAEDDTLSNFAAFSRSLGAKAEDTLFLEKAREEFARFFQGPAEPPAYPWEGPYLSHETTVFQPSTLKVRAAYAGEGLQVRKLRHVPDDHVSLMSAFMAALSARALSALEAGNFGDLHRKMESMYRFSQEHMATWLPDYAAQSLHVANAVMYPQMIHGLRSLVALDAVFLGETLAWLDEVGPNGLDVLNGSLSDGLPVIDALIALQGITLRGIEDNELVPLAD